MKNFSLNLYLEINDLNYIFFVGRIDEQKNCEIIYEFESPLEGIKNKRISDLEKVFNSIKKNLFTIEQQFSHTFTEIVLILDNFETSSINLTGFKKLNGSQVLRENIIYILNKLKSNINEVELNKTIIHIFNSKFCLDNKQIDNLPIGLFGDFYTHELSFILMNKNDYKNIKSIFDRCNLNIKKIFIKSFIKGVAISNKFKNIETFFQIIINENNSKILYFENNSLKSEQSFNFGSEIIINDISKITLLQKDMIKTILKKVEFKNFIKEDELIEKNLFKDKIYRKIKKKLIYDIAFARIREFAELILYKNTNYIHYNATSRNIFLELGSTLSFRSFLEIYKTTFSNNGRSTINFVKILPNESTINTANILTDYGWKKEAIPTSISKKSIIARFFEAIFN